MARPEYEGDARDSSLDRLIMFSDGIFAIAITLLVIDLKVPDVPEDDLGRAVRDMTPSFYAYVLSFLVIGIYWMAHRRKFTFIARDDSRLTWMNIVFLMLVAFLPFPTAMLGEHDGSSFAVIFYAATNVVIGAVSILMWWYAVSGRRLTRPDLSDSLIQRGMVNPSIPALFFLLSIPVAFVDADWAKVVWLGIAFTRGVRSPLLRRLPGSRPN